VVPDYIFPGVYFPGVSLHVDSPWIRSIFPLGLVFTFSDWSRLVLTSFCRRHGDSRVVLVAPSRVTFLLVEMRKVFGGLRRLFGFFLWVVSAAWLNDHKES